MSESFQDHIKNEIAFVEDKIIHLSVIISDAWSNEVKQYFSKQQQIAHAIRSELYNLAHMPMKDMDNIAKAANAANPSNKPSSYNESSIR